MARAAIVTMKFKVNKKIIAQEQRAISTDLPAADLGDMLASVISKACEDGIEPIDGHVVVYFG